MEGARVHGPAEASVEHMLCDERRQPLIVTREVAAGAKRFLSKVLRREAPDWAAPVFVASIPLVVDRLFWPLGLESSWQALAWIAMGAGLNIALLGSSTWAWMRVQRLGGPIDRMLPRGPERNEYVRKVGRRLHLPRTHYAVCALGAGAGLIGSYFAQKHLPNGTFGVGYYIGIALLGFLAGDTLRWLVRAPLILLRPLTKISPLQVVMHAPAWTPAIREMGQLAAETAVRAALGFFLFGLPLVWAALSAKGAGHGHSGPSHSQWIGILSIAPLVISALTVVYVTFVPQRWLSTIIERERNRVLDELARTLPEQGPDQLLTDVPTKTMALYDAVAGATTATAEGRLIFRRALLVVGALAPQLYVLSLKLLGVDPPT